MIKVQKLNDDFIGLKSKRKILNFYRKLNNEKFEKSKFIGLFFFIFILRQLYYLNPKTLKPISEHTSIKTHGILSLLHGKWNPL